MINLILRRHDGAVVFTEAGRKSSDQPCLCGHKSRYLCDYPMTGVDGGWCNARLCSRCREPQRFGVDYCKVHHELTKGATT